jgi:hypothetical protein
LHHRLISLHDEHRPFLSSTLWPCLAYFLQYLGRQRRFWLPCYLHRLSIHGGCNSFSPSSALRSFCFTLFPLLPACDLASTFGIGLCCLKLLQSAASVWVCSFHVITMDMDMYRRTKKLYMKARKRDRLSIFLSMGTCVEDDHKSGRFMFYSRRDELPISLHNHTYETLR